MTKYILHGGNTSVPHKWNKGFFNEITKRLQDGDQVLIVYFSREDDEYDRLLEQDKRNFLDNADGKEIKLVIASKYKNEFIEQVEKSEAVYMRGGGTLKLIEVLKSCEVEFRQVIRGKVVAGSSAGVYALSKYFIARSIGGLSRGIGLLPIAARCHYDEDKDGEVVDELKKYTDREGLELVLLRDCEYKVIGEEQILYKPYL